MAQDPTEDAPLTRRERHKLELRGRILKAAVEEFDRVGFSATKVSTLCEKADIAHKTFFNHFPTKHDLLREIASVYLDNLLADIEDTRKQPVSTRDRIQYFFERIADNSEAAGPMHRELVTEVVHVAHEAHTESEQARVLHAAFGGIIQDGADAGDIVLDHDHDALTNMLMGAFYALMFNWANLEDYPIRHHAVSLGRLIGDAIGRDSR